MCGICGIFNYGRSDAVEEKVVLKMRDTMIHRGPDDKGVFLSSEGIKILPLSSILVFPIKLYPHILLFLDPYKPL